LDGLLFIFPSTRNVNLPFALPGAESHPVAVLRFHNMERIANAVDLDHAAIRAAGARQTERRFMTKFGL
jgi:hypothetical protein